MKCQIAGKRWRNQDHREYHRRLGRWGREMFVLWKAQL